MKTLMLLGLLASSVVVPATAEAWFCDEGATKRNGQTFECCGIASAEAEALSREQALHAALREFNAICDASDDCRNHDISVDPKRTECQRTGSTFKCTRMIQVHVLPSIRKMSFAENTREASRSGELPKIRKGFSKAEILRNFGKPDLYLEADNDTEILNYVNTEFCEQRCTMVLQHDRVYKFSGFKLEFTDALETKSFWQRLTEGF